ncbi:hypothetical protein D3C73_937280 [compost metagenome]
MQAAEGRLLAAVLSGRGAEGAADLADQLALSPQAARLVQEGAHLRGRRAEAGAGADDDGVVVGQFRDSGDRRGLVQLVARIARQLLRHGFRNALDVNDGAFDLARALGDGFSHLLDVAIGRVIQDEDLGHERSGESETMHTATASVSDLALCCGAASPLCQFSELFASGQTRS